MILPNLPLPVWTSYKYHRSIGDYQPDWQSCRSFCASAHPRATWFQHEFDEGLFTNDVGREGEGGGYHQFFDAVREVAAF